GVTVITVVAIDARLDAHLSIVTLDTRKAVQTGAVATFAHIGQLGADVVETHRARAALAVAGVPVGRVLRTHARALVAHVTVALGAGLFEPADGAITGIPDLALGLHDPATRADVSEISGRSVADQRVRHA